MTSKTLRIEAIDAARGTAMLFVFLSHFGIEGFRSGDAEKTTTVIFMVTKMATPTFMIISGMMLGYLFRTRRRDFPALRERLVDRGLFFFLVGHVLISLAYYPTMGSFSRALQALFITDVIGLCLVIVPFLVTKLGPPARVTVGLLGYAACWAVILGWSPHGTIALLLKHVLVGIQEGSDPAVLWYSFSFLPWLCLYLCFTVAGERLAVHVADGSREVTERLVAKLAGSCLAFSLSFILIVKAAKWWGVMPVDLGPRVSWLTIDAKTPPGPIFVLYYGGIGITVLYLLMRFGTSPWMHRYFSFAKTLGRVSFFAFILQYFVYELFVHSLHPRFSYIWPLYFALSVAFIGTIAHSWHRHGFNRYFSFRSIWLQLATRRRGDS